jgi:hypothetical protein
MTNAVKAMLLSGLVFPGLGQLVLKYYTRGIALTLATFVCFYVLMENVMQQATDIVGKIDISSGMLDEKMIATAISEARKTSDTGETRFFLWALLILWLIGIVDAYIIGSGKDRQTPLTDRGKQ